MKRYLFFAVLFFSFCSAWAQINFSQNFNAISSFPSAGWNASGFNTTTSNACEGRSARASFSSAGTKTLIAPNQAAASNGNGINVSFNYKIINSSGGTATPSNFGSLEVQYSTNNGSSYSTAYTINQSNHSPSVNCTMVNFTIPAGTIPAGNGFRLRFSGTWAVGSYYIYIDEVSVSQNTGTAPGCNTTLITPTNGAVNVPVTQSSISWSAASGVPTGYFLRVGTVPGGSDVIPNVDVGNTTSYPISLNYSQTYYVGITPYNSNGNATGCIEQSFSTATPVTASIPWTEDFQVTALPEGWGNAGFIIGTSSRLPNAESHIIFKNLNASVSTAHFSTVSAGQVQAGQQLSFVYRLGDFTPEPYNPPAAGSGNFIVSVSTDYGMNYTDVQTVVNNGIAGWQNYYLDLSAYAGEFIKVKITANRISGDYFIGFDDFYIGNPIYCEAAEDLNLEFIGSDKAEISWQPVAGAENYLWFLYSAGANPSIDSPIESGSVPIASVILSGLSPNTNYDFYVQTDCGSSEGLSFLSEGISFTTGCETLSDYPFAETFENDSSSRDCWTTEYLSGHVDWAIYSGTVGGEVTQAHTGEYNALFYYASYANARTKLVSPALDLNALNSPVLRFWYANEAGANTEEQNELRVYYKNAFNAEWILIPGAVYTSDVNVWTQVELNLPEASDAYYIAFEGTNYFGLGIVVDDVLIGEADVCASETVWDGFAWSNGSPDASKKAVIEGSLVLNENLEACELEITENGSLEIPAGYAFSVNREIRNLASPEDFIVSNEGNLIQIEDVENIGGITVFRESNPMLRLDYTLWSSPVSGQNLFGFSPETVNGITNYPGAEGRIYVYDGANGYVNPNPFTADSEMEEGTGYLFRAPNNWGSIVPASYMGEFTGIPTNGNVNVVTHAGNYTSIGNPYPSNLSMVDFLSGNPGVSALYFWNNNHTPSNNYASCTIGLGCVAATGGGEEPQGSIPVGQGFIVETTENTVQFTNAMRTAEQGTFFKIEENENHRFWLNFSNISGAGYNQILIGYLTGATNGVDHQIDAQMFGYNGSAIYSLLAGGKYVIQGRAVPFETTDVVPLGIKAVTAGQFVIHLANSTGLFADGQSIFIHDKYLGIVQNLSNGDYTFSTGIGEFHDRFDIIYESEAPNCPYTTLWNGLTWSNGLPDTNKKAIINGAFVMNQNLEACELEVTANGSLEIPSGFSFTVNGSISNQASAEDFTVANDGNLIQIDESENTGAITVIRESQDMLRLDYTLWSSPVANQNLFDFSPETVNGVTNYPGSTGRIYIYEGASGYVNPQPFDENLEMEEGLGYLFRAPNNWSATTPAPYIGTFTGVPNNGNIVAAAHASNYTSIGNPYPSNITANGIFTANPGINAIYFWNNNHSAGNNYATCTNGLGCVAAMGGGNTPNGILTTGQGFIVHTDENSVVFNNTMRADDSGIFFKVDELESHRFWLNLDGQNESYNQILVGYVSGATNQIDAQIDAKLFNYTGSALYNLINEEQYVIQGRALPFESNDVVPLGFRAAQTGKFKISLADFDGIFAEENVTIYLKDKNLNIIHDLMESDYEFESTQGEFKERFEVVYETEETMGTGELDSNWVQIYQNENHIIVSSKTEKILSVELFDLSGKNLHRNPEVNANIYRIPSASLKTQVLVVKVQTEKGEVLTKKIINQ